MISEIFLYNFSIGNVEIFCKNNQTHPAMNAEWVQTGSQEVSLE